MQAVTSSPLRASALLPRVFFTQHAVSFAKPALLPSAPAGCRSRPGSAARSSRRSPGCSRPPAAKGPTPPRGGHTLPNPSCPPGNHLRSLNPTYLQRSGIIQLGRKSQELPCCAGGGSGCPASSVPPPASPGALAPTLPPPDPTARPTAARLLSVGHRTCPQTPSSTQLSGQGARCKPPGVFLSSAAAG